MSTNHFISVREASQLLGISEKKIMDLIEDKKLTAFRIANQFLRLKKSEVMKLRQSGTVANEATEYFYTPFERFKDFLYFNDFYFFCILLISILLYLIFFT